MRLLIHAGVKVDTLFVKGASCVALHIRHGTTHHFWFQNKWSLFDTEPSYQWLLITWTTGPPFYWHGLTCIPAWIGNHMPWKVWYEITYPFPNFNDRFEMREWIINFIPHFTIYIITHPCHINVILCSWMETFFTDSSVGICLCGLGQTVFVAVKTKCTCVWKT